MRRQLRGLQLEIVSSLFVVMLAGIAIVAVVMASLAVRTVQVAAFQQLELGAGQLRRLVLLQSLRQADLAALLRTQGGMEGIASWAIVDGSGRPVVLGRDRLADLAPELLELARAEGRADEGIGLPIRDLIWLERFADADGRVGYLLGTVPADYVWAQLRPLFGSGAWVLGIAATVFVAFGSYLLRKRIVSPVHALSLAARRIAAGELDVRTPATGSDELAELAHQFNEMAASLERERDTVLRAFESLARSQRLATVGQLAAGVAHEVGNPVAAILGYVEVAARDKALSERSRTSVEHIRKEALRVRALVRELLDLARPEPLAIVPQQPAELLARVSALLKPQKVMAGVELVIEADANLPQVYTDARRVEQILINLVENAAHALRDVEDARIVLRATISDLPFRKGRRSDDRDVLSRASGLVLDVCDNGPGIASEHMDRIFDPFFTTKDPGEGTGLGLWNAHRLAEALGGRLEARSEPGSTRFSLVLPLTDTLSDVEAPPANPDHR